jgi:hypothetical protein
MGKLEIMMERARQSGASGTDPRDQATDTALPAKGSQRNGKHPVTRDCSGLSPERKRLPCSSSAGRSPMISN